MKLNSAEEADGSASHSVLDCYAQDLAAQVLFFEMFSGITAHSSVVSIPVLKGGMNRASAVESYYR